MKALIGAFGTRGDVQPMVALAHALLGRGHQVTLVVPPSSVKLARDFGLDAVGLGLDYEDVSQRAGSGSLREILAVLPSMRDEVQVHWRALEPLVREADVLAGSSVITVGTALAEALGKPYAFFTFCPQLIPSGDHPSPLFVWQGLPRWLNRLTWAFNDWGWNRLVRRQLNEVRRQAGLKPIAKVWPELIGQHPILACDESLARAPTNYPVPISQVGPMFVDDTQKVSDEVEAFLRAGAPPVYIGFGSMSDTDPRQTTERLIASVRRANARALISRGWAGLGTEAPSGDVLFIGPQPHRALFPRCAAVVHHGGAGTTHAAARAGVPQVVMPQILDQHYWADRIHRLRLSPPKVARHGRDPELLAAALRVCLTDVEMQARARAIAKGMRTDGAQVASDVLERLAARPESRAPLLLAASDR